MQVEPTILHEKVGGIMKKWISLGFRFKTEIRSNEQNINCTKKFSVIKTLVNEKFLST